MSSDEECNVTPAHPLTKSSQQCLFKFNTSIAFSPLICRDIVCLCVCFLIVVCQVKILIKVRRLTVSCTFKLLIATDLESATKVRWFQLSSRVLHYVLSIKVVVHMHQYATELSKYELNIILTNLQITILWAVGLPSS